MAKSRKFKVASVKEDLSFELAGEEFFCYPELDYRRYKLLLAEMTERAESEDDDRDALEDVISTIASFISSKGERERFVSHVHDEDTIVSATSLMELWTWLMTEYKIFASAPEGDAVKN